MPDADDVSARLERLETRAAFQDETIDSLNATITGQWRQIDALAREVAQLRERLRDAETSSIPGVVSDKPPHY